MATLVADLRAKVERAAQGGDEAARAKHLDRGKLLPRERLRLLLDPGSPFLELSQLAAFGVYEGEAPGAGIITGVGRISGRECAVVVNDATVKGGTYYPITVKKHLRAQEIALQNRLPCLYLVDSGGAFLPEQDSVFPDRDHFGRIFYNQATMSAAGIPQIAAVMGSCTRRGCLRPGDGGRIYHRQRAGHDFSRRPAAREGGDRGSGFRRGARRRRGAHAAVGRRRPLRAERYPRHFDRPLDRGEPQPHQERDARPARARRAALPREELHGVIPADTRKPTTCARRSRASSTAASSTSSRRNTAPPRNRFARIWGYPIGVVANNGILFSESALKGTHFIELASQRASRFFSCKTSAASWWGKVRGGRHRQGRRQDGDRGRVQPGAEFTVIIGGSFGAGNYGMCAALSARAFSGCGPTHGSR